MKRGYIANLSVYDVDESQCSRRRFGPRRPERPFAIAGLVVAPFLSCEPWIKTRLRKLLGEREEEARVNELLCERPKADSTVKRGVYFSQRRGVYGRDSQVHQSCLGSEGATPSRAISYGGGDRGCGDLSAIRTRERRC